MPVSGLATASNATLFFHQSAEGEQEEDKIIQHAHIHLWIDNSMRSKHTLNRHEETSLPNLTWVSKWLSSEEHPVSIIASITTGGSRRRKSSTGDAPLPKWVTEQSHVWIKDGESMQALWQYPSWWESNREKAFRNWKTINNKITFILFQVIPHPLTRTHPGNGVPSHWRGTSGIKEKSRKCVTAKRKKHRLAESLY